MPLLTADRQLLDAFRRGEREALARVYQEYAPGIAAFLARGFTFESRGRKLQFRGYHQPFDQDNALQETFVRAFSERARLAYDGLNPYRNYLTTIARNWVLTEMRHREVAMSQLISECDDERDHAETRFERASQKPDEANAEQSLLDRELAALYHAFVEALEEPGKGYFVARFEKGATQVEAGKVRELSHMQARTLERKLRKRFLAYMQARGYLDARRGAASGRERVTT